MKRKAFLKKTPIALPTDEQISAAFKVLQDQATHWYQLLLFNGLTSPGGGPVVVERGYWENGNIQEPQSIIMLYPSPGHPAIYDGALRPDVMKSMAKQYGFAIRHDDTDETVLAKVKLMMDGLGKPFDVNACCSLATRRNCVCVASFSCPIHGDSCVGSHD